jgi:hypothetical protein
MTDTAAGRLIDNVGALVLRQARTCGAVSLSDLRSLAGERRSSQRPTGRMDGMPTVVVAE